MTIECNIRNCRFHAPIDEGPFCHEPICKNGLELVYIWPDNSIRERHEDMSGLSDDYITAVVNDDGTVPSYDEAITR